MPKKWGTDGGIYIGGEGNKEEPTLGNVLFERGIKLSKKTKSEKEEKKLKSGREQLKKREEELRQTQNEVAGAVKEEHQENRRIMQSVRMSKEQRSRIKFGGESLQKAVDTDRERYELERAEKKQRAAEAGDEIGKVLQDLPVENTLQEMRDLEFNRVNLKKKKGDALLPKKLKREEKNADGFQPEKIDHDIFNEWRDADLEQKEVLPLLKKTILRFNEVLLKNISHAREWAKEARILYDTRIDPNKGAAWRYVGALPTVKAHKAWALDTFLQSAVDALKENKPIPEDTTYYKKAQDRQNVLPTAGKVKEKSVDAPIIGFPAMPSVTSVESPEIASAVAIDKESILKWVNRLDEAQESQLRDTQFYKACLTRKKEAEKQGTLEQFFKDISRQITDLSLKRQHALALFLVDHEFGNVQKHSAPAPEPAKEPQAHGTFERVEAPAARIVSLPEQKEQQNRLKWIAGVASEKDSSHKVNQDASYVNAEDGVIAVFDGMGGYAGGEKASSEARKVLEENANDLQGADTVARASDILKNIFKLMSDRVKRATKTGGTTATVAKIVKEGNKQIAVVGNLGDSRAYVFRAGAQTLEQITTDDDLLAQVPPDDPLFKDVGEIRRILSDAYSMDQLTDQNELASEFSDLDIAKHPDGIALLNQRIKNSFEKRNPEISSLYDLFDVRNIISKHVDRRYIPAVIQTELAPGDIIFCTSDGIHDNLTREVIQRIITQYSDTSPSDLARVILTYAQETADERLLFRSKPDDMTVVILKSEGTAISGFDAGEGKSSNASDEESGADTMATVENAAEIEKTQKYRDLLTLYSVARDNDIVRGELLRNWRNEAADAKIETEIVRAIKHILAQIDEGKIDAPAGGGGRDSAAHLDTREKDMLYAYLHSLQPDIAARKEIEVEDEFNVRIIGTEKFPKAEIEEISGNKIEIRLPVAKKVMPRKLELGRVYQIRITKTNQRKEKKSGGGKHYWHEAEVIGPNMRIGDMFSAQFDVPKTPGVYRAFAPDGLAVFVDGPENLDITKSHDVVIERTADFSRPDSKRHHRGKLKELEFSVPTRAAGKSESVSLVWGDLPQEKKAELAADCELFMKVFPEGIVTRGIMDHDNETGEAQLLPRGNLDAEACVFLLQIFFKLSDEYLAKTSFVRPGEYKPNALNVDTGFETTGFQVKWLTKTELAKKGLSVPEVPGQKEEDKGGAHVVIVQDHGPDANRTMSAFKLLYDALIDRYGEDAIPPENREPMKNFVKFVTHIDNFTAPTADFDWKKAWEESDKIPFTLTLAKQNFLNVRDLYRFFQKHPFEDAFKRPSKWTVGAPAKLRNGRYDFRAEEDALKEYGFGALGRERKDRDKEPIMQEQYKTIGKGERYFEYLENNEPEFIVKSRYGKILVVLDGDHVPGRLSAAMAHGIDGMLEWKPGAQSFWFNVAPQKNPADYGNPQIPQELAEDVGGVWVRGSIVTQPDWKKEDLKAGLTLGAFLEKIGVPLDTMQGRLRDRVREEDGGGKPWETLPEGADFFALKAELKQKVYEIGPLVISADPNQKTVNGEKEKHYLRYLKRSYEFRNYPINAWVMAVHEWFNDQIMNTFMKWMDEHIVVSVDAAAGTITRSDGMVRNKKQFIESFETLPEIYSNASDGLWKGAVGKWFDAKVSGGDVQPVAVSLPASVSAPGDSARGAPDARIVAPAEAPAIAGVAEAARAREVARDQEAAGAVQGAHEGAPAAAEDAVVEAEARAEQSEEDARVADAQAELERVTDRLVRARAAKEQYEGVLRGLAGFITGKGSQAEAEYDAALQEYQSATERLIGGALEEGLKWRTRLVEKMIDAKLATPEKKGLGARTVELWKSAGEASLYNYIDKKGGWKDKRGFAWGALKILSKAANLRTATALSLFGGGWIAGATAVGWSAAGAGAGLSALGSSIGFNEWTRHGYETGRASGSGARAQVFKDQAEAEAHYQAEYASAGRFKKLWRGLSGQGFSAEGAAAKAVWLDKLGNGNVTDKRRAIAERMLAYEADAMLFGKKDLLNDASYQKLAEAYKEAVAAEEQIVSSALEGYFEAQGKGFVDALDKAIGGEKSALRRRKVFSAFAGATLGLASLANFDVRSFVRGLGSEGKPPAGIVPAEDGSAPRVASTPSGSESATSAPTVREGTSSQHAGEIAPSAPSIETAPAARSPFADLIRETQGERAWSGVRKIAGGEYAHIVPQRGHRAVIQAVKELLHADPQKFGMGAHPSDALVEAKATAIAHKLGFMGHGYSLGFKFDAQHPVGLFAKDGQISIVAENEETLHRLMGAVKRGGGVMKPDVARPFVENAFPKIRAHAIFMEGQSGQPVDATQVRVSTGAAHHGVPRAEDFGAGRGNGASARVGALRGAGVPTSKSLTASELVASHAGATVSRGARGVGEFSQGARTGTGVGAHADIRVGGSGAGVRADGGRGYGTAASRDGGGGAAHETAGTERPGGTLTETQPVVVRTVAGIDIQAASSYSQADVARIRMLAGQLADQYARAMDDRGLLRGAEAGSGREKLLKILDQDIATFKNDTLKSFKDAVLQGKASVKDLEDLVGHSPLRSRGAVSAAGEAAGNELVPHATFGTKEGFSELIASAARRIVTDSKKHILSVWNAETGSAVSLELPDAFEVTPRFVRGKPLAVSILTPGGAHLKGVIKFVKGAVRVVAQEGEKKIDMPWKEFLKKY